VFWQGTSDFEAADTTYGERFGWERRDSDLLACAAPSKGCG
jgi:hypothetical protein